MTADRHSDAPDHLHARTVLRRWPAILLTVLIFTAVGIAALMARTPTYTATADVLLRPLVGNPFSPDTVDSLSQFTVGLETEAHLVDSSQLTRSLPDDQQASLADGTSKVSATVVLNSQIIRVSFTAGDRADARRGANAVATAFLQYRKTQSEGERDSQIASLNHQIAQVNKQLTKATKDGSTSEIQVITARLSTLQQSLGDANSTSITPGTVVVPASSASRAGGLASAAILGGAITLGLVLGMSLAVWRTWRDTRIDWRQDEEVAGLRIWATVPHLATAAPNKWSATDLSDELRRVRTLLLRATGGSGAIALAGPTTDTTSDTSMFAAALARAIARAGYTIALVDAVIDHPRIAANFGLHDAPGVSDVATGSIDLGSVTSTHDGVAVVPAGTSTADARDLYAGRRFADLVDDLCLKHDFVFVVVSDLASADGLATASVTGKVLIVTADSLTTHDQAHDAVRNCHQQQTAILGVVNVAKARHRRWSRWLKRFDGRKRGGSTRNSAPKRTDGAGSPRDVDDCKPTPGSVLIGLGHELDVEVAPVASGRGQSA